MWMWLPSVGFVVKTQSGEIESVREQSDRFDTQSNFESSLVQEKHITSKKVVKEISCKVFESHNNSGYVH
jgi:hypothetical protein